jgi:hypothetical protein
MEEKLHAIKSIALALAILVVFNLFIGMGIRTFYPGPEFDEFCPVNMPEISDENQCRESGGQWIEPGEVSVDARRFAPAPPIADVPFCDEAYTCRQEFEQENTVRQRNVFVVWVIAGFAALLAGYLIERSSPVSAGFVFGGVVAFVVGSAGYWTQMDEILRFSLLGVVLAVLIWLGYRRRELKQAR